MRVHELLARGGVAVSYATSREPGWRKQAPTPQFGFYQARVASDDFIFDELNPNLLAP